MDRVPREISAADFKARCLKLMDKVAIDQTEIVITKRGRPVAKLVPYEQKAPSVFGFMAGTAVVVSDIVSPLELDWNAESE